MSLRRKFVLVCFNQILYLVDFRLQLFEHRISNKLVYFACQNHIEVVCLLASPIQNFALLAKAKAHQLNYLQQVSFRHFKLFEHCNLLVVWNQFPHLFVGAHLSVLKKGFNMTRQFVWHFFEMFLEFRRCVRIYRLLAT